MYSKKSFQNSDNDFSDELEGEALIVKWYVSRSDKKPSRLRRFQSGISTLVSESTDAGGNFASERIKSPKYLKYGVAD